jgi:hypothetical protein
LGVFQKKALLSQEMTAPMHIAVPEDISVGQHVEVKDS